MSDAQKRVREKFARRELVTGVSVDFQSMVLAKLLSEQNFDLVFIDCEHGGAHVERVAELAIAIGAGHAVSVLRPWSRDPGLLRRYLDCGIDGLIVPQIESGADVDMIRALMSESSGTDRDDAIVIGLIESVAGVEAIDDILSHPGIDSVLMGPADLAVSLGLPRRGQHALVQERVLSVLNAAKQARRSAGVPIGRFDLNLVRDAGANLFMYASQALLVDGIRSARVQIERIG